MNLLIASNNSQKIKEIKSILKDRFDNIVSLKEAKINCDPEENGQTFYENALIKANEIAKHTSFAVLADDTGLCVDALNGEPGVNSARYAGNHNDAANRSKLLERLNGITDRSAHFKTCVVLRYPDGKTFSAIGRVDGRILEKEDGENGFGYDSLFYCNEINKSFGQATEQEKNAVSHRARALTALLISLDNSTLIIR